MNWEYGSDWHWPDFPTTKGSARAECLDGFLNDAHLYESGRAALLALIQYGISEQQWTRVWMPTYYCSEVVSAVIQSELPVSFYSDNPLKERVIFPPAQPLEVVLVVNYFGYRNFPAPSPPQDIIVVEDHTHDPSGPWARSSKANYCFASLRKVLPIPDGGVLWSPQAAELPAELDCHPDHFRLAEGRIKAMQLKADYLAGKIDTKVEYRELYEMTEKLFCGFSLGGPHPKTIELLNLLSLESAAIIRRANFGVLSRLISKHSDLVFDAPIAEGQTPLGLILYLNDSEQRDAVKERLISHSIYPAIIWPADESFDVDATNFSQRMLFLPCDHRYNAGDLGIVADKVDNVLMQLKDE